MKYIARSILQEFSTHFVDRIIHATIIELMMESKQNWNIVHGCVKNIMQAKVIKVSAQIAPGQSCLDINMAKMGRFGG